MENFHLLPRQDIVQPLTGSFGERAIAARDGMSVRIFGREAESCVDPGLQFLGKSVLEAIRLFVQSIPRILQNLGEKPLQ
jgi:hypothetical protein